MEVFFYVFDFEGIFFVSGDDGIFIDVVYRGEFFRGRGIYVWEVFTSTFVEISC